MTLEALPLPPRPLVVAPVKGEAEVAAAVVEVAVATTPHLPPLSPSPLLVNVPGKLSTRKSST